MFIYIVTLSQVSQPMRVSVEFIPVYRNAQDESGGNIKHAIRPDQVKSKDEQGSSKWEYIYFPTTIPILLHRSLSFGNIALDIARPYPCSAHVRFLCGGRF